MKLEDELKDEEMRVQESLKKEMKQQKYREEAR
jgi:hypothetical protein